MLVRKKNNMKATVKSKDNDLLNQAERKWSVGAGEMAQK